MVMGGLEDSPTNGRDLGLTWTDGQPSLRDSGAFDITPNVETLGYSRLIPSGIGKIAVQSGTRALTTAGAGVEQPVRSEPTDASCYIRTLLRLNDAGEGVEFGQGFQLLHAAAGPGDLH
jgi:hypothetical protein